MKTNETPDKHSASHTPGPWSLPHFAQPGFGCQCGYVLTDGFEGAVCTVHASGENDGTWNNGDNPKFEEACANARLIAAAPDLLACVRSALRVAISLPYGLREQFEIALAKAEAAK